MPHKRDENGRVPLHRAALNGHYEAAKLLIDASEKHYNEKGYWKEITSTLLPSYALPTFSSFSRKLGNMWDVSKASCGGVAAQDNDRLTPLHLASGAGHYQVVKLLVSNGSSTNALSNLRATPLHYASIKKRYEIVKFLVENGSDPEIFDCDGKNAYDYALEESDLQLIRALNSKYFKRDELKASAKLKLIQNIHSIISKNREFRLLFCHEEIDMLIALTKSDPKLFVDNILDKNGHFDLFVAMAAPDQLETIFRILVGKSSTLEYVVASNNRGIFDRFLKAGLKLNLILDGHFCPLLEIIGKDEPSLREYLFTSYGHGSREENIAMIYQEFMAIFWEFVATMPVFFYEPTSSIIPENILRSQKRMRICLEEIISSLKDGTRDEIERFNRELFGRAKSVFAGLLANSLGIKLNASDNLVKRRLGECAGCYEEEQHLFGCLSLNHECDNFLCANCIKTHYNQIMAEKNLPFCANNQCNKLIIPGLYSIAGISEEELIALITNFIQKISVIKIPKLVQCKNEECIYGEAERDIFSNSSFYCPLCFFEGCLECGEKTCSDACRAMGRESLELFAKLYRLGKLAPPERPYDQISEDSDELFQGRNRMCPNCGLLTERADGCNAMTCKACYRPWHWNNGLSPIPHDHLKAPMNYEDLLKEKGFLDKLIEANLLND